MAGGASSAGGGFAGGGSAMGGGGCGCSTAQPFSLALGMLVLLHQGSRRRRLAAASAGLRS
ncbi:MAG: hypothetical protein INH41_24495 [Myxococcaceae bacterium]|nr:hypothetical protein [Myxococcaceae bacterium]